MIGHLRHRCPVVHYTTCSRNRGIRQCLHSHACPGVGCSFHSLSASANCSGHLRCPFLPVMSDAKNTPSLCIDFSKSLKIGHTMKRMMGKNSIRRENSKRRQVFNCEELYSVLVEFDMMIDLDCSSCAFTTFITRII